MPVAPASTGNALVDSRARAEHFKALTAHIEMQGEPAPVQTQPNGAQSSDVRPNAEDAELLKATHADAMKRFSGNAQVNSVIDQAYRDLHAGKRLDREAMSAAFAKATETSETRADAAAVHELARAVDPEGNITPDRIPRRLMHGYSLPAGVYVAEQTIGLLSTARELGLTQSQIDRYVELQGRED